MNIKDIESQYPEWKVNALGKKDMDNIRALIAEVFRLEEVNQLLQPDEENRKAYALAMRGQKAEIERLTAEVRSLNTIIGLFHEYKAMVHIGSAEAIGEAEDRLSEALSTASGRPTPNQEEFYELEECLHGISIFKNCEKCDSSAESQGERFFILPNDANDPNVDHSDPADSKKELIVSTMNPAYLDETLQQFGGVVGQNPDGSYTTDSDGNYTVRAMGGDINFLKFAMKRQGYAEVIGEHDVDHDGLN